MRNMRRRINRLFGNINVMFNDKNDEEDTSGYRKAWTDFREKEDEYLVAIELSGVDKEEIQLEVSENRLCIKAEKRERKEKKGEEVYSFSSSFARSVSLPENVKINEISAEYRDGVLMIRIPKREAARKEMKRIKIN